MGYTRCFQILASCPIVSMIYCRVALLTAVCNHEPMVHSQSVLRSRFIFLLCNLLRSRRSVPITSVKKYKAVFPIPQAQKLRSLLKAGTVLYCMSHIHILTQWAHPTWFINKRWNTLTIQLVKSLSSQSSIWSNINWVSIVQKWKVIGEKSRRANTGF